MACLQCIVKLNGFRFIYNQFSGAPKKSHTGKLSCKTNQLFSHETRKCVLSIISMGAESQCTGTYGKEKKKERKK